MFGNYLRHGGNHPPFYSGSLQDALREALEAPGRPVAERRPLAVYLHNDRAIACNIFAKNVHASFLQIYFSKNMLSLGGVILNFYYVAL